MLKSMILSLGRLHHRLQLSPIPFVASLFFFSAIQNIEAIVHKGGTLNMRLSQYPRSFNPYTSPDAYGVLIGWFNFDSLISPSFDNYAPLPRVAARWQVAADRRTYTFHLNPAATFHDGKPITAADVKFSFDTIYNRSCILCQSKRDYLGPMESVTIVNFHTVVIRMKNVHFDNLVRLGEIPILAKHIYGAVGKDFNRDFDRTLFGSGPYKWVQNNDRKRLTMVRKHDWWGIKHLPHLDSYFNFDRIHMRVITDDNVAFELFKKKKLDYLYVTDNLYAKWDRKKSYPWRDPRCKRLRVERRFPGTWRGIALNTRSGPTKDRLFRKAVAHLYNHPLILKKIYKNKKRILGGPFNPNTPYSSKTPAIAFDPKRATELLVSLGYTQVTSDGIRYRMIEIDGKKKQQRAQIELMHAWEGHNKWATIFKHDARKVGVDIRIKLTDWTTALKLMDEFKFDAFVIGWSGNITPAPEQLFSGRTANQKGTSNYPGLNIKEIDDLIRKGPLTFNPNERFGIYNKLEKLIIHHQPYVFTAVNRYHLLAYWSHKINPTPQPFLKFSGDVLANPFYARWSAAQ